VQETRIDVRTKLHQLFFYDFKLIPAEYIPYAGTLNFFILLLFAKNMKIKPSSFKKIPVALLVILMVIQFFRIDKTNPPARQETDFIYNTHPSPGIGNILKTSCYDCHSYQTVYPWYANVAPISWWLKNHINEGRHHLNFSEWTNYSSKKTDHKLEECVEMIQEGEMPLYSYTLLHRNAVLNAEQQHALVVWFESLRTYESEDEHR
jgi:heme-binding protein